MATILDKIVATKRDEVARLPEPARDAAALRDQLAARGARDFRRALSRPPAGDVALIAEIKKASPSAGVIRADFDPVRIAREYEAGGAACLSVLTDETYFQGRLDYLKAAREAVSLPLLRKDFLIDPRQVEEAIAWGADAVLLIVAILDDALLKDLRQLVEDAGLTALVEAHDADEFRRALDAGATVIGVNNRNLKTFNVDLGTTQRVAAQYADEIRAANAILVGESGIHTRGDVETLKSAGVGAILVGESLMRQSDMPAKIRELVGGAS